MKTKNPEAQSAAVTLAFAASSADDATDDTAGKQAQLRVATVRISDLIRHCKLICGTPTSGLAIWRSDGNGDSQININELVFIEKGTGNNYIRLCEFPESDSSVVALSAVSSLTPSSYNVTYVNLLPQCVNVTFTYDQVPPLTTYVNISFDLTENNIAHQYEIGASLLCWAGNLLNDSATTLVSDDD